MRRTIIQLLVATAGLAGGSAQVARPVPMVSDRDVANRVTTLSAPLHFTGAESDSAQRYAQLEKMTDRVRQAVDTYVQEALRADEGSDRIQTRLRTVLADHRPNPEYGDLPLARVTDLRAGRSLIVAYTLVRGPHNDVATIRGYRWNIDRFEVAASAGDDFDGYSMFKAELPSPASGEFWLLAWGQAHTFNGKKVRARIYGFDGQAFRTVWAPDDMINATLRPTVVGFGIDRDVPYAPYQIHDEYRLTLNGPVKIN